MKSIANSAQAQFPVHYRTARIDGLDIFYREAGPKDAPALLLLHGFPSSSNQFRNLIPRLAGAFRLIAPDYPGYGQSSMPDHNSFAYTFDNYAAIINKLLERLGVTNYIMYVFDYGAPVGFRLALLHPERVAGFVVQNGNAYAEGLREFWDPIKKYWATPENREQIFYMASAEKTRWQYENGVVDKTLLDPTAWTYDQLLLDRPGNGDIQADLMLDYGTNLALYPKVQAYFREHQPPTLVVWAKNDFVFPPEGATPYSRDLQNIETHFLDTGHFALETHLEEIAGRIESFFVKQQSKAA